MVYDFFESIDTEAKAYYFGLLSADGSIQSDGNRVSWTIKESDFEAMRQFLQQVNLPESLVKTVEVKLAKYTPEPIKRIDIYPRKMNSDFTQKGVVAGRSLEEFEPFLDIDPSLVRHYIRGLFDADGWLTLTASTREAGICSSEKMCNYVKAILNENGIALSVIVTKNNTTKDNGLFRIRVTKKSDMVLLAKYLYTDANFAMDRKLNKAYEIIEAFGDAC